jgi:hypothetical protein
MAYLRRSPRGPRIHTQRTATSEVQWHLKFGSEKEQAEWIQETKRLAETRRQYYSRMMSMMGRVS